MAVLILKESDYSTAPLQYKLFDTSTPPESEGEAEEDDDVVISRIPVPATIDVEKRLFIVIS